MEIFVSRHADERMKERIGIKSEQRRQCVAEKAFSNGVRIKDADRVTQLQIESRVQKRRFDYVVYHDQLFVFSANILVTVLPVDQKYRKIMEVRRAKKKRRGNECENIPLRKACA